MFGTVESISPLRINIEQKLVLDEKVLILTKAVVDHWVDIEVDHYTVNDDFLDTTHHHLYPASPPNSATTNDLSFDPTHKHEYQGRKKIMIYNGLLVGEKVILIRLQGGQRYVVLDRINDHTVTGEWV